MMDIGPMLHPNMHKDVIDYSERIHMVSGLWPLTEKEAVSRILKSSIDKYGKIFYRGVTLVYKNGCIVTPCPGIKFMPRDCFIENTIAITHHDPNHICYKLYGTLDDDDEYFKDICNPEFVPPVEDPNDLTIEQIREIHRKIWDYVLEYGEKPRTMYLANCVLCTYVAKQFQTNSLISELKCSQCPTSLRCRQAGSLHNKWRLACQCEEFDKSREFARQIRDIEIQDA